MATIAMIHNEKRQARAAFSAETRIQRAMARLAESGCPVLILGNTAREAVCCRADSRAVTSIPQRVPGDPLF